MNAPRSAVRAGPGPHHRRPLARHAPARAGSSRACARPRDRVRETLFNWLHADAAGRARARPVRRHRRAGVGSAVARRGAARCWSSAIASAGRVPARRPPRACRAGRRRRSCRPMRWPGCTRSPMRSFDLAFVDPPFDANLWGGVLPALVPELARRTAGSTSKRPRDATPRRRRSWRLHREGRTREVRYALYRRRRRRPRSRTSCYTSVTLGHRLHRRTAHHE